MASRKSVEEIRKLLQNSAHDQKRKNEFEKDQLLQRLSTLVKQLKLDFQKLEQSIENSSKFLLIKAEFQTYVRDILKEVDREIKPSFAEQPQFENPKISFSQYPDFRDENLYQLQSIEYLQSLVENFRIDSIKWNVTATARYRSEGNLMRHNSPVIIAINISWNGEADSQLEYSYTYQVESTRPVPYEYNQEIISFYTVSTLTSSSLEEIARHLLSQFIR